MDSGDISSFVTNGEWDLIGEKWALYNNMNNRNDYEKEKEKLHSFNWKRLQVKVEKCILPSTATFFYFDTTSSFLNKGISTSKSYDYSYQSLLRWLMKIERTDNDKTEILDISV